MLRSDDNGKSWREEKRFFQWGRGGGDTDNASAGGADSPGDYCRFTALPDGRLAYYGQSSDGGIMALSKNELRDDTAEWEIIRMRWPSKHLSQCFYQLRQLPGGAWAMLGTWQERLPGEQNTRARGLNNGGLVFLSSSDEGKNWTVRSVLYDGRWFPYQLCEPGWVIEPDGALRVFTREDLGYGPGLEFVSKDQGRSWSAAPMRFMGHHIFADNLPDGKGVLASFRAAHYIHAPAVGAWWDNEDKWGRFLHIDNIPDGGTRYHADMSQWVDMGDGSVMLAYSIPPKAGAEVRVRTARFTTDQFSAPDVCEE
jgi:hypothetical protein